MEEVRGSYRTNRLLVVPQETASLAALAQGLNIPIDRWNVLTHCEAALIDGYGPYSGDAETRWDLWYLRDSPGDGAMKPGGQVIRGKALWYAKSSPLV